MVRLETALAAAPWALKEWTTVCDALLAGSHAVIVRKGGIHEPGFAMRASAAWLFPTGFHAPDVAGSASRTAGVPIPGAVAVVARWPIPDPALLEPLAPFTPLSPAELEQRFTLRPQHQLWALLVRAHRLHGAAELPWHRSYGGCRSWVQLVEPPGGELGPPVRPSVAADLAAIEAILGPGERLGDEMV